MLWFKSNRADAEVLPLADRHYNRQKIGSTQFVPPGRCLVLKTLPVTAFWVTSWPFAEFVLHDWAGAWICSAFRNEGEVLSSVLIHQAVEATRAEFGPPPSQGMVTFIDRSKIRHKRDPGRCYRKAGFTVIGETKSGLLALGLSPDQIPAPRAAQLIEPQLPFEGVEWPHYGESPRRDDGPGGCT